MIGKTYLLLKELNDRPERMITPRTVKLKAINDGYSDIHFENPSGPCIASLLSQKRSPKPKKIWNS